MTLDYRIYRLTRNEKMRFIFKCYGIIFATTFLFYDSIIISLLLGFTSVFCIKPYEKHLCEKRRALLKSQFRDLLYCLSSSFASGRQMTEAIGEAITNLEIIYEETSPIVLETKRMLSSIQEARESEESVLADFAARSGVKDIVNFTDVYITCRNTGGNLEKAVMSASRILMEKIEIDEEIRVMTVQKIFEGRIISLMPLGIILFLRIVSPDYLQIMYETVTGRLLMTVALACIIYAGYLIRKITFIEV